MIEPRRHVLYLALLLLLTGAAAAWSGHRLQQARAAAEDAARDLGESRMLVGQIRSLRERPVLAGARELELTDLARVIEQAAERARIQPRQLDRIWPEPPRRVGDSDYQHKPTRVMVRSASLEQLGRFFHALSEADQGLTVSALRLVAPRSDAEARGAERWTAEMTLTYLIYAPRGPQGDQLARTER